MSCNSCGFVVKVNETLEVPDFVLDDSDLVSGSILLSLEPFIASLAVATLLIYIV